MIDSFTGKYYFLSNFYPCEILWEDKVWRTSEHIFQAMKTRDTFMQESIRKAPTPGKAKRFGREVKISPDWNDVRADYMYRIVLQKFKQHPDLRKKLLATGDEVLVEGNHWGDTFWGVYNGEGENRLGKILMRVREEIRANNRK